jgi:hypothetical protein
MNKVDAAYVTGFNDGIYHATDLIKSVARDLGDFNEGEDATLLRELADVILEDLKKEHDD